MNPRFWRNKKVLVTGYEGFLGSHLTQALVKAGAQVVGLDIRVHRNDTLLKPSDYAKIKVIKGSVADLRLVQRLLKEPHLDFVFHLAAEALVGACLKNPLKTFQTNIQGTWNVLEAARLQPKVKGIVIASSDKAYGWHRELPYREEAALKGDRPYDVSKSCTDLLAATYAQTYHLPVAVTRCGNIFGPGDFNFSRLIPDTIRCALNGQTLKIRSDGKYRRDYIYVADIVDGYLLLAENLVSKKLSGQAFNLSDERPRSVLEVVRAIYAAAGKKPKYKIFAQAKDEIPRQYLASAKARRVLGWKPRWSFSEGVEEAFLWYRDSLAPGRF